MAVFCGGSTDNLIASHFDAGAAEVLFNGMAISKATTFSYHLYLSSISWNSGTLLAKDATNGGGAYRPLNVYMWAISQVTDPEGNPCVPVGAPMVAPCPISRPGEGRIITAANYPPATTGALTWGKIYQINSAVFCPGTVDWSSSIQWQLPSSCAANGLNTGGNSFVSNDGAKLAEACLEFCAPSVTTRNCGGISKNGDSITWTLGGVGYSGRYAVYGGNFNLAYAARPTGDWRFMWRPVGGTWRVAQTGGNSCTVDGLEPCTTYETCISLWNSAVTSAAAVHVRPTSDGFKVGFAIKDIAYPNGGLDSGARWVDGNSCTIKTDCATPPEFGAYSASATGQTTGRFSWTLSSPGAYSRYNSTWVDIKREIEPDSAYRRVQTWGADTTGSGTLSGLVPGERYTVRFTSKNAWGTRGYGLTRTVYRTFRTRYPVASYTGPYSNGEPGDTRFDYQNVSTYDNSRWQMVLQMPQGTDNNTSTNKGGTIVGVNDVSGRKNSTTWSLFNRSTAEMTSTILNDLGLKSIPLTGSGTIYSPTGNKLAINGTNVTSSVTWQGGKTSNDTSSSIMNHRMWVKTSNEAWQSVKAKTYDYRTDGNNMSVTWNLASRSWTPNVAYNLRSVVTNSVGMYTVTDANLYPPAYNGQGTHTITPTPSGTADNPHAKIQSCVTTTGGLNASDSSSIKYHVFEGRPANSNTWTELGRGGAGQKCHTIDVALPRIACNQNYIIRVTVYNVHNLSVRTEYTLTPPTNITISSSTHNEIGIGYITTNATSSGSARVAKRETFWQKTTESSWHVSEINYTISTGNVTTRTPRVLEHDTPYRAYVKMTNEYGLCADSTQTTWTTLPRYRLWDNIFRRGTIRALQHPRVRSTSGLVLNSQNVYFVAAHAIGNLKVGDKIKKKKLRFPKGWHSGTQYECWRITFTDGSYIQFWNEARGYNSYAYSRFGYFKKDATLIAEFYNERDKWKMAEYQLPELTVASITAQYSSGSKRGVRQSAILNRTEVIDEWL